ncbi:MAG: DUF72 domain-containing protein [Actinomycetota bacterium]|nr:DUF72 domain-containing protein [Actinomycetota bacterium]
MTVYVGTSGWQYKSWRGRFYPEKVAQGRWLEWFAERFQVVEVNNTFYRLPPPETFRAWAQRTPADFVVAPKLSRYLTHVKRLKDPDEPVRRFLRHAAPLGDKLGPLLVQLPPDLAADVERLDRVLALFPEGLRVAVEFRHESWFTEDVRKVLESYGAALCLADRRSRLLSPLWQTAEWAYVRLHEGTAEPRPCYGRTALATWSRRLADTWGAEAEIFVFFNNDPLGCAVRDAAVFAQEAERAGLRPTRVPALGDVKVG